MTGILTKKKKKRNLDTKTDTEEKPCDMTGVMNL